MTGCHQFKNIPVISLDGNSLNTVYDALPVVLAIGTFDGVHLGHQNLIQHAIQESKNINGACGIYTFSPHPTFVLCHDAPKPMIIPLDRKYELLTQFDICGIFEQNFDISFSQQSPEWFLQYLAQKFPTLYGICVGKNFRFGKDRIGDVESLKQYAKKYDIFINTIRPVMFKNERISSSRIRHSISSGNIDEAVTMLGHDL